MTLRVVIAGFWVVVISACSFDNRPLYHYDYFATPVVMGIGPTDTYASLHNRGVLLRSYGTKFEVSGAITRIPCAKGKYYLKFNLNNDLVAETYFQSENNSCYDNIKAYLTKAYGASQNLRNFQGREPFVADEISWDFRSGRRIVLTKYDENFIVTEVFNSGELIDRGSYIIKHNL